LLKAKKNDAITFYYRCILDAVPTAAVC
jgi:hypothetical protein